MSIPAGFDLDAAVLRKQEDQLGAFGNATATFWPGGANETAITVILHRSARAENSSPGNVERAFVVLSQLPAPPQRGVVVQIDGINYSINQIEAASDGGAEVLLRRQG